MAVTIEVMHISKRLAAMFMCAALIAMVAAAVTWRRFLWTPEAAGWAQALGTVTAIAGALLLSSQQSRNERRSILTAASRLPMLVMDYINRSTREAGIGSQRQPAEYLGLTSLVKAMEELPLYKLPAEVLEAYAAFVNVARQYEQRLLELRQAGLAPKNFSKSGVIDAIMNDKTGTIREQLNALHAVAQVTFQMLNAELYEHRITTKLPQTTQ